MGGYGSGRWRGGKPDRKVLVESCLALDINALARAGVVRPNSDHWGEWRWWGRTEDDQNPDPKKDKPFAALGFHVQTRGDSGSIKLDYSATVIEAGENRAAELMSYRIDRVTSGRPSGGSDGSSSARPSAGRMPNPAAAGSVSCIFPEAAGSSPVGIATILPTRAVGNHAA